MVADRHDAQAVEEDGGARGGDVGAGADVHDAGSVEVLERVEQRDRPVIERVVVGEGDRVDAELGQPLRRHRRRAEEERLARVGEALSAVGDAALEVEHEAVGARSRFGHFGSDQRHAWVLAQALGDAAAQHRVAGEGEADQGRSVSCARTAGGGLSRGHRGPR